MTRASLKIDSLSIEVSVSTPRRKRAKPLSLALTRPAWLVARVRYQLDLIELCAREVEARGLLTSDVPERAVAALRRWCEGSDGPGDRASWALKPTGTDLNIPTHLLGYMVREVVRTRAEGERAVRDGRDSIGNRGLESASSAVGVLREVGVHTVQALHLVAPSPAVLADDPAQGRGYDRMRQGVAIDELRESTPQGTDPDEKRIREACAKYGASAELTDELVEMYGRFARERP